MLPFLPILIIYITLVNPTSMIAWWPMVFEVWTYLFWELFFSGGDVPT